MPRRLPYHEEDKRRRMFHKGLGWCVLCKQFKPLNTFSRDRSAPFGHQYYCKKCHYKKYSDKEKMKTRARRLSFFYVKLAGGKCKRCHYDRSVAALDFHHVDRNTKEDNPARLITNGHHDKIIKELDKCILLCANCHREFGAGYWIAEFVKCDGLGWMIKPGSVKLQEVEGYNVLPKNYRYIQKSFLDRC